MDIKKFPRIKYVICLLAAVLLNTLFGQTLEDPIQVRQECCAKHPHPHYPKPDPSLVGIIIEQYLEEKSDSIHINNRYALRPLYTTFNDCDSARLTSEHTKRIEDKISINVSIHHVPIENVNGLSFTFIDIVDDTLVLGTSTNSAFGLSYKEDSVQRLDHFSISWNEKKYNLLEEANDLFKLNICETFKSIRPVEAYLSNDGEYLYVYFFGIEKKYFEYDNRIHTLGSYMCKYVIHKTDGFITRIVADQGILRDRQWMCEGFIGF